MNYKIVGWEKKCKKEKLYCVEISSAEDFDNHQEKESFLLTEESLYAHFIVEKINFKLDELIKITTKDLHLLLQNRALNYFALKQRTKYEIESYLKRIWFKKYSKYYTKSLIIQLNLETIISSIIKDFENKNYIDDENYAKEFVEERILYKQKSFKALQFELKKKGINQETINRTLESIETDELDSIKQILQKKYRIEEIKGDPYSKENQKVIRYLQSKGFEFSKIERFIKS